MKLPLEPYLFVIFSFINRNPGQNGDFNEFCNICVYKDKVEKIGHVRGDNCNWCATIFPGDDSVESVFLQHSVLLLDGGYELTGCKVIR